MSLLEDIRRGGLPSPPVSLLAPRPGRRVGGRPRIKGGDPALMDSGSSKPRLIENIQLVPPSATPSGDSVTGWTDQRMTVPASFPDPRAAVDRTRFRDWKGSIPLDHGGHSGPSMDEFQLANASTRPTYADKLHAPPSFLAGKRGPKASIRDAGPSGTLRRPPRTAAVSVRSARGDLLLASIIRRAREEISLSDLGISGSKLRKSTTGNLLIEIPGPEKADVLAERLRTTFGNDVVITHPVLQGGLKLTGLDESITPQEVVEAVSAAGGCRPSEVKPGIIRELRSGMRVIWVQCPLAAAY